MDTIAGCKNFLNFVSFGLLQYDGDTSLFGKDSVKDFNVADAVDVSKSFCTDIEQSPLFLDGLVLYTDALPRPLLPPSHFPSKPSRPFAQSQVAAYVPAAFTTCLEFSVFDAPAY